MRSARRYATIARNAKAISGAAPYDTVAPHGASSARVASAMPTGTSSAGSRSTTGCSETAASAPSHQPTIGGWS